MPTSRRRSPAAAVSLAALQALALCGCYHARVVAPQQPIGIDPTETGQSDVLWSFAWGLAQDTFDTTGACKGDALQSVTAHSNLGFDLMTVVTLGFLSATTVTVRCAKPPGVVVTDGAPGDEI